MQISYKTLGCQARPFGIIDKLYILNSNMFLLLAGSVGQVLLKGPHSVDGEGRPRHSQLGVPPNGWWGMLVTCEWSGRLVWQFRVSMCLGMVPPCPSRKKKLQPPHHFSDRVMWWAWCGVAMDVPVVWHSGAGARLMPSSVLRLRAQSTAGRGTTAC